MKIGILSRSTRIYSTKKLIEAAEARGHEVTVFNPLKCYMNITSVHPDVYYKNKDVQQKLEVDAVIPRIGASVTLYGTAVLRQFEVGGVYTQGNCMKFRSTKSLYHKYINSSVKI